MIRRLPLAAIVLLLAGCGADDPAAPSSLDRELHEALVVAGVTPLDPLPAQPAALVTLGRSLMFDRILSGNRDISCASCHHPLTGTSDNLSLSIGTGGAGAGAARALGAATQFVPRNSPELFNRGYPSFRSLFWDGRVANRDDGGFDTPAGDQLPAGLSGPLAAQAMFPVMTRLEMRGAPGENELADLDDADHTGVWAGLMARLLAIPEYVALFQAAYPGTPVEALGFQHAANALAAFQTEAFTSLGTLRPLPPGRRRRLDRGREARGGALLRRRALRSVSSGAPPDQRTVPQHWHAPARPRLRRGGAGGPRPEPGHPPWSRTRWTCSWPFSGASPTPA